MDIEAATRCQRNGSDSPPDITNLYISLSRTAGILEEPVATINRLRNDSAFPRRYNFDTASINGCPAIERGPFFRFDEIRIWKRHAGDFGTCDPPPDKRETAVPAGTRHDGISVDEQEKHTLTDADKQGTPCSKCQWLYRGNVRSRGRWWSACNLSATRDPGVHCSYFLDSNRGLADGQGDRS